MKEIQNLREITVLSGLGDVDLIGSLFSDYFFPVTGRDEIGDTYTFYLNIELLKRKGSEIHFSGKLVLEGGKLIFSGFKTSSGNSTVFIHGKDSGELTRGR